MEEGKNLVFNFDNLAITLEELYKEAVKSPMTFWYWGSMDCNDLLAGLCTELSDVFSTSDTHFPMSLDALGSSYGQCYLPMVSFPLLNTR